MKGLDLSKDEDHAVSRHEKLNETSFEELNSVETCVKTCEKH